MKPVTRRRFLKYGATALAPDAESVVSLTIPPIPPACSS